MVVEVKKIMIEGVDYDCSNRDPDFQCWPYPASHSRKSLAEDQSCIA